MKTNEFEELGNQIFELLKGKKVSFAKQLLSDMYNAIDKKSTITLDLIDYKSNKENWREKKIKRQ